MGFFSAYFDESDSGHCSVVAGVVMSVSQIPHFDREWKMLLKEEGLDYFHMKEFAHFKDQFAHGWKGKENEARRANFLSRVVGIIARRCNISISMTLDRQGYQNACAASPLVANFYINEYTAAGIMALMRVGNWADNYDHNDPIAYVFDDGNSKRTNSARQRAEVVSRL